MADADVIVVFNGDEMQSAPTPENASSVGGRQDSQSATDDASAQQFRDTERAYGGREAYDRAKAAGKTKLNYRQWVQVRTPNFKAWFGDWENDPANASKVTDPQTGEPMVVYHGTSMDKDFSKFKVGARGAWFTSNSEVASEYAEQNDSQSDRYNPETRRYEKTNTSSRVMPVFLKVTTPYRLTNEDRFKVNTGNYAKAQRDLFKSIESGDGILWNDALTKEWVVLDAPTQIKSAAGNTGDFDGTNPNITAQRTNTPKPVKGLTQAEFRDALIDRFGQDGIASLERQGLLNFAPSPAKGVSAWYEDGKAYFDPSWHASGRDAIASVLHEVGTHHGIEAMLGKAGWRALKGQIVSLARKGGYVRAVWDGVVAKYPEFESLKGKAPSMYLITDGLMHEIVAKVGETAAGRKSSIWRDILAAVNRFLLKMGVARQINQDELADLVQGSLKRVMAGKPGYSSVGGRQDSQSAMKSIDANIRRGMDALAKAVADRTSVHRAMFRNGLGWVDFVWGSEGTVKPSGKTKGAMGLSHIIEARQRKDGMSAAEVDLLMTKIVEAIARGGEVRRDTTDISTTVVVENNGVEAILTRRAGSNGWLLSGWNVTPGASGAGSVAAAATSSTPTTAQRQGGAGVKSSVASEDGIGNPGITAQRPFNLNDFMQSSRTVEPPSTTVTVRRMNPAGFMQELNPTRTVRPITLPGEISMDDVCLLHHKQSGAPNKSASYPGAVRTGGIRILSSTN